MKALRSYKIGYIKKRDSEYEKAFEIEVYQNIVIYYDEKGNERTLPMYFVSEVVEYAEDRYQPKKEEKI